MQRLRLKRRLPGVPLAAFVLVAVIGSTAAAGLPILGIVLVVRLLDALGLLEAPAVLVLVPVYFAAVIFCLHQLGKGAERAWRLRAPWGHLAIGRDGFSFDGWARRAFVPWSEVRGLNRRGTDLVIARSRGGRISLGLDDPGVARTAMKQARGGTRERVEIPAALTKAEPRAWLQAIRGLSADDYRGGAPTEVLVRVLEHPMTPPLARLGAARALATREPVRVRAVAAELADEETATALERALEAEPDPETVRRLARRS